MDDPSIMSNNPNNQHPTTSTPNTSNATTSRPLAGNSARDPPPHDPVIATTGHAQETRDARRTPNAEERAARLHQAEIDRLSASMVSSVNNHISDEDLLKADGSNFTAWEDFIEERMRGATGAALSLSSPKRDNRLGEATVH
ncbi:hypothetical protein PGTUg99_030818 [Puccinia graminis f. sp. tritici]|uniref:Uncharacterized protein n=1 Tax=Puccinia graminis f. sp. tritici TaxID=56615 RepID=A0A5B0SF45_PUCGR|nr:hypothetical protein PGTUg99_030818 [Puccinia graminis f. sp. tritici]